MGYFEYGTKELGYLKQKDKKLGYIIDEIGMIKRKINKDLFSALIASVISQQISTKAAVTVESRLLDLAVNLTPENIAKFSVNEIQKCGMSFRKSDYIKSIAEYFIENTIDFANLNKLEDPEIIKELTKLKGVGAWTAEMMLIHTFERRDILSFNDLGIRRGIMKLYSLDSLSKEEFEEYKEKYSPYGTVASLYLWEISSKEYVL
ncbi:MAG: DNA-3-methyladenine glycosylase 2 family protein [Clostridium sp.]|nr:DNA-3-methyladenine glycosylase 2 family protein [Clostridium sp.]